MLLSFLPYFATDDGNFGSSRKPVYMRRPSVSQASEARLNIVSSMKREEKAYLAKRNRAEGP